MIDLHCHILPALDDGALDLDDAVGMARQAEADGIGTVCATPHIRHDHDVTVGELAGRVAELAGELSRRAIEVTVLTGAEVAQTAVAGLTDAELRAASLGGGGRWILLEPAPGPLGAAFDSTVADLVRRGFRSVVAHPERHAHPGIASQLRALVEGGALIQVTAAFVTHEEAAPLIVELAESGLVHLLGSDAHSSRAGRPVSLSAAIRALSGSALVAPQLDWMTVEAPAAIVAGRDVSAPFGPGSA